jgi:hypothetical protein
MADRITFGPRIPSFRRHYALGQGFKSALRNWLGYQAAIFDLLGLLGRLHGFIAPRATRQCPLAADLFLRPRSWFSFKAEKFAFAPDNFLFTYR